MVTPRERPILFSAPMVRAILDGRKTQTRRVVKPRRCGEVVYQTSDGIAYSLHPDEVGEVEPVGDRRPLVYAEVGDRLWVRETWRSDHALSECTGPNDVRYAASVEDAEWAINTWRPSIFMPRWASRILLEVTAARVEHLQALERDDAIAEGIPQTAGEAHELGLFDMAKEPGHLWDNRTSVENFRNLWEAINGKRAPWATNPLVHVVTFKRC